MVKRHLALALASSLLLVGSAAAREPLKLSPENAERLRRAAAEILFWDQAGRDARFPTMEALFPGDVARASPRPFPLMDGKLLDLGAGDPVGAYMAANSVAGLIVVQDGKVRLERYARGFSRDGRYTSFSVAKSLTSTLVGAAIQDGHIKSVDDPVTRYIPALAGSAYDGVTIRQVLTMTSGVRWNEDYTNPASDVASMYQDTLAPGEDATVHYLRKLPREAAPGTKWVYKTGETNLIGVLVSQATGRSLAQYAEEKIWRPFGMERDLFWMVDMSGQDIGGCCLSASLRDYARIGQFVLDDGIIDGKRVVPKGWFAAATRTQAQIGEPAAGYGYQWWTASDGSFRAIGIFGQLIHVDPARRLVIVTSSAWPKATDPALGSARDAFVQSVVAAADARR